ncbi:MAG: protein translocase subunit SecD [Pseudomonadota bacterium]|nr:protein translocase subunit SecD [Pseudomonadota bacterium]
MNRYPLWKNLLVLGVVIFGTVLALPNIFGDDPALQVSREDGQVVPEFTLSAIRSVLEEENIDYIAADFEENAVLVRFDNVPMQLQASGVLREALDFHIVALTLAPRTPAWLRAMGLKPMSLGLDLRGGVHFLYQVDLETATQQYLGTYVADLNTQFREERLRARATPEQTFITVQVQREEDREAVSEIIGALDNTTGINNPLGQADSVIIDETIIEGQPSYEIRLSESQIRTRQDFAIQQNTTTLRNRVNELGVAEPIVQRQGINRIVVQLPGVQDPAQAERILGATATLEIRLVDWENDAFEAQRRNRPPLNSILREQRDGTPVLLRREIVVSGDQLVDATSGYSQGQPAVFIRLDAQGGQRMLEATQTNLRRPMAVVYIEEKPELVERGGEQVLRTVREETVINVATIQGVFSSNFQITGLSPFEAQDLAPILRAGALAAPIVKVEERTIGPSLGQDNIEMGRNAVMIGFLLVVAFMLVYYRVFGLAANLALFANLILIVALLSLLQASLTLPGIAGIVLTVGMAVDANVLIFERIREELANGNSPQASIRAGYEKAFSTIADANVTTFIAALVLFMFGTGPIKGFAITLSLGILTSMFTAIIGTRAIINLIYGSRQVERLAIGGGTP